MTNAGYIGKYPYSEHNVGVIIDLTFIFRASRIQIRDLATNID